MKFDKYLTLVSVSLARSDGPQLAQLLAATGRVATELKQDMVEKSVGCNDFSPHGFLSVLMMITTAFVIHEI